MQLVIPRCLAAVGFQEDVDGCPESELRNTADPVTIARCTEEFQQAYRIVRSWGLGFIVSNYKSH